MFRTNAFKDACAEQHTTNFANGVARKGNKILIKEHIRIKKRARKGKVHCAPYCQWSSGRYKTDLILVC